MGKKHQGHYCYGCDRFRSNEKFTGKGHRKHLCKDCVSEGVQPCQTPIADYDRRVNNLSKAIKNCLILFVDGTNFFLFEYQGNRYLTTDDFESEILLFQAKSSQKFIVSESLKNDDEPLMDVLCRKYYNSLDSDLFLDYDEVIQNESIEISKKRRQHLEVILSIHHLGIFR